MKDRRQRLILQIIRDRPVSTQEELTDLLLAEGIKVTQATVSRDIKELQLIKVPDENGVYRYTVPEESSTQYDRERLLRILRDSVVSFEVTENIVVVKTVPAAAGAVAEAIDRMEWPEVVGTVAGDNTLFIAAKPHGAAEQVSRRLQEALGVGSG